MIPEALSRQSRIPDMAPPRRSRSPPRNRNDLTASRKKFSRKYLKPKILEDTAIPLSKRASGNGSGRVRRPLTWVDGESSIKFERLLPAGSRIAP